MADEAVDNIVMPIVKELGAELAADCGSVSAFVNDDFYHCVTIILRTINPDSRYNARLPPSKAARFRLTSALSNEIKDMGFSGACGYEAFLYPNDQDVRKMLIWLVDKLPKTGQAEQADEAIGTEALQARAISNSLKAWVKQVHDPTERARKQAVSWRLDTVMLALPYSTQDHAAARAYSETLQPLLHRQCTPAQLPGSLFELNARETVKAQQQEAYWSQDGDSSAMTAAQKQDFLKALISGAFRTGLADAAKIASSGSGIYARGSSSGAFEGYAGGSAFQRKAEFAQEQANSAAMAVNESGVVESLDEKGETPQTEDEAAQALKEERERKLAEAAEYLRKLEAQIVKIEEANENQLNDMRQMESQIAGLDDECKELKKVFTVKKRTLDLLPNAEENYRKLSGLVDASSTRILKLGVQWEQTRAPLIAKYRRRKLLQGERKQEVGLKVEQIKVMRAEMREKAAALKAKTALLEQVTAELKSLPKAINREVYVKRIMDVVKNLNRQKEEINKILDQVRSVQKAINQATQTQMRSFSLADDTVYTAAKREQQQGVPPQEQFASTAYRNIVQLRDGFASLVKKVETTGHCKNDIMALQQKIEGLEQKNTTANMKTVMSDLTAVRAENEQLIGQAKKLKAAARLS